SRPRKRLSSCAAKSACGGRSCGRSINRRAEKDTGHPMSVAIETIEKPPMARQDAFDWQDPLDLESELTQDERMVRDTARSYAQDKLFPRALKAFREESFDPGIAREMGALGLLAATLPEEYGGSGFGPVAYGLIAREIERADSGYRSFM